MTDTPTPTITGDIVATPSQRTALIEKLMKQWEGVFAPDESRIVMKTTELLVAHEQALTLITTMQSEHAALLAERDALREAVTQIRNDIFQHMVRYVHDKNSKSYGLIGTVKERLTKALTSPERTEG